VSPLFCSQCDAEAVTENAEGPSCSECNECRCGRQLVGLPEDGEPYFFCPACDLRDPRVRALMVGSEVAA
jgi:hypothetical protein